MDSWKKKTHNKPSLVKLFYSYFAKLVSYCTMGMTFGVKELLEEPNDWILKTVAP